MSKDHKEKESVHIYLKADDQRAASVLQGDTSAHEKYIILMNETLQSNAKKDMCTIKDLEARIAELEDESDSFDSRRNYLKSLVKNFHEMHKINEKITELQTNMKIDTQKAIQAYKLQMAWYLGISYSILVIVVGMTLQVFNPSNSSLMVMGILITTSVSLSGFVVYNIEVPSFKSREEQVTKLSKEKKKINEAQDYIHEFIDAQ